MKINRCTVRNTSLHMYLKMIYTYYSKDTYDIEYCLFGEDYVEKNI